MATDLRIIVPTALSAVVGVDHTAQPSAGALALIGQQPAAFAGTPLLKTSFTYSSECTWNGQGGGANCNIIKNDGLAWVGTASTQNSIDGNYTEAVTAANNPSGDGGLGARFWVDDGVNQNTKPLRYTFPSRTPEFWLRWYQRYESGFKWKNFGDEPHYDKTFYMRCGTTKDNSTCELLPQFYNLGFRILIQNGGDNTQLISTTKWSDIFGTTSDGLFHRLEVYIKLDTDGTDGIGKAWIDGTRIINNTSVDYSDGDSDTRLGVGFMDFQDNQSNPDNGQGMYIDYDDIEIWNTTPPNTDSFGDPWIGPV